MKSSNFSCVFIAAATVALGLGLGLGLAACSNDDSDAQATITQTVTPADQSNQDDGKETVTVSSGADANAEGGNHAATDLPTEITGYSGEAEHDLTEERLTKEDVTQVLQRAHNGEGKVEWDDDGYWEVEVGDIEIDIDKNGLVLDVDR